MLHNSHSRTSIVLFSLWRISAAVSCFDRTVVALLFLSVTFWLPVHFFFPIFLPPFFLLPSLPPTTSLLCSRVFNVVQVVRSVIDLSGLSRFRYPTCCKISRICNKQQINKGSRIISYCSLSCSLFIYFTTSTNMHGHLCP